MKTTKQLKPLYYSKGYDLVKCRDHWIVTKHGYQVIRYGDNDVSTPLLRVYSLAGINNIDGVIKVLDCEITRITSQLANIK